MERGTGLGCCDRSDVDSWARLCHDSPEAGRLNVQHWLDQRVRASRACMRAVRSS